MNHTIRSIIIVVVITSMLFVGATTVPIMQNSLAHKKSTQDRQAEGLPISFPGVPGGNTNTNTNSAESSSSSDATAENTNNIDNSATATQNQSQSACAVAVSCPEGSTTVTVGVTPPPADPCPHSPYTDFVAGVGCQDGEPQTTCNPSTVGISTATLTDDTCTASLPSDASGPQLTAFIAECRAAPNGVVGPAGGEEITCTFSTTQACPTPTGSTQTPTVVNGRCTIQPGPT